MTPASSPYRLSFGLHAIALAVAAMLSPSVADAQFRSIAPVPQKLVLQDSLTSPDGTWILERYLKIYPEDAAIALSLHHTQKAPVSRPIFIPYKFVAGDVHYKWLDNSTLLIATAEGTHLETWPDDYYGVKLLYGYYPEDPDTPRIPGAQKIFNKTIDFTYRFDRGTQDELPGLGCYLHMTALDGAYLHKLALDVSASKIFLRTGKTRALVTAYSAMVFMLQKNVIKPLTYNTGVKLQAFSPDKEHPRTNTKAIKQTLGSFMLDDQGALLALIRKIKEGDLHVKYGFWLDNAEVIYTNSVPQDMKNLEAFERCISQDDVTRQPER